MNKDLRTFDCGEVIKELLQLLLVFYNCSTNFYYCYLHSNTFSDNYYLNVQSPTHLVNTFLNLFYSVQKVDIQNMLRTRIIRFTPLKTL